MITQVDPHGFGVPEQAGDVGWQGIGHHRIIAASELAEQRDREAGVAEVDHGELVGVAEHALRQPHVRHRRARASPRPRMTHRRAASASKRPISSEMYARNSAGEASAGNFTPSGIVISESSHASVAGVQPPSFASAAGNAASTEYPSR